MRYILVFILGFLILLPQTVSAHVVVSPNQAAPGEFRTFSVSVPNERNNPVVAIRLVIPSDVKHVTPSVKQGWKVTTKTTGSGNDTQVTEIAWDSGSIGVNLRDDFSFSAQTPKSEGEIHWKAYQTYQDGTIDAWDQAPTGGEVEGQLPYSSTTISTADKNKSDTGQFKTTDDTSRAISLVALTLSIITLGLVLERRR